MCTSANQAIDDNVTSALSINRKTKSQPAYVTQLTEKHFATPKRRQRYLSLLKSKLKSKEMTIRNLRKQNRRLSKKVAITSSLLANFKNKKLITDSARALLVCEKIVKLCN